MAIQIEFQGFVNEVKNFDWGTVYNISHNQVRKTPQGTWETVGRDYFSVVAPEGGDVLAENMRVQVKGRMKTKTFEKRDGSKGMSLEVRADSITIMSAGTQREDKVNEAAVNAVWPTVNAGQGTLEEMAPF
jgi:single-stranded DNA-binding protein